ncbi:MAG: pitrilysin family protein [Pseudomonadota bacterium]
MTLATSAQEQTGRATHFKLKNGLDVVVIPDNRAPVVTHMLWYRVGAADEPIGKSGIAHFLEHLMFKSTDRLKSGEFSKTVARLGGNDNAFTSQDATAYFQRVAKQHLPTVMEYEANRMTNLRLTNQEVETEKKVVLEERRSRVENKPLSILVEQMEAALYMNHPYGIPIIGWHHEIVTLNRKDALDFYKRFYAPNNAVLVVSGDVTVEGVRKLAKATYGQIPANPAIGKPRVRVSEPPQLSPRRMVFKDPRVAAPQLVRRYLTPGYSDAQGNDAYAMELLGEIAFGGATSRLYKRLIVETNLASSAGGWYYGGSHDGGKISVSAIAAAGVKLEQIEAEIDAVIKKIVDEGITKKELERAKRYYLASYIYQSDNQASLARRYGFAFVTGRTLADVEETPARLKAVTVADVNRVAKTYFDMRRTVTGYLLPSGKREASAPKPKATKAKAQAPAAKTKAADTKKAPALAGSRS